MAPGHIAETPTDRPARLRDDIAEDRVCLIVAGVAFYGLLALFPNITALIAVNGLPVEPSAIVDQLRSLFGVVPQELIAIITDQATAIAGSREDGFGLAVVTGVLVALYSASKGMSSLMEGINIAYDEHEKRGFIRLKLATFAQTIFLILGLVITLLAMLGRPAALGIADLGGVVEPLISIGLFLALPVLTMLGLSVLYPYAPSRDEPEWKWASLGRIERCLLRLAASAGFPFYVSNFGSYNDGIGALAGDIVVLTWFWISAFIILKGAELNAELEAHTRVDATAGRDQPVGQRDAKKAGRWGEAADK
ncbi:YihY/virulence factor BrkB family protein [Jannaschia sp. CCS1]|uniref:YihY/virulence factor BrkB family protein n=1 Tax=Jannaschia sp. (strain CCS1) TaxID=290400 RepID=UPI000053C96A|nr:YihY/virulence factor BrkB family protein [Jannaschia sp. CCS1]ABD55129.1 ribonuclease BN putative [Jannaschia sp. CCS1]